MRCRARPWGARAQRHLSCQLCLLSPLGVVTWLRLSCPPREPCLILSRGPGLTLSFPGHPWNGRCQPVSHQTRRAWVKVGHTLGGGVSAQRKGGPVPEPPDSGADVGLCHHLLFKKQRDHACHPLNTAVCPAKLTFFLRGRGSPSVNLELNTFLVEKICVLKNKSRSPVSNRPGEEENNKLPPRWEEATMIAQRRALMKCSWKLRVKFVINLESQGLAFSAGK